MAESTSGEDQVNPASWLATCTIPERVRGANLAWNFWPWSCKQNHNQACLVKITSIFFVFLLTLILSRFLRLESQTWANFVTWPTADRTFLQSKIWNKWSIWSEGKTALKLCIWQGIYSMINMQKGTTFLRRWQLKSMFKDPMGRYTPLKNMRLQWAYSWEITANVWKCYMCSLHKNCIYKLWTSRLINNNN